MTATLTPSPTAPLRQRRIATPAALMLVHAALAVVTTAPLAWRMSDRIPLGREPVATVPFFNLWSIAWTAQRIPHGLSGWMDAPIFWPASGAYAGSELQPLTGAAYWLLRPLTGPTAAYGLILLTALTLTGVAANRLARRLGAGVVGGLAAGVLAQSIPFLFHQLGVLQLSMVWPVLFGADTLLAWSEDRSRGHAIALGLWISASVLTCGYHAVLGFGTLLVVSPLLIHRTATPQWRARLLDGALALAIVAVVCAPFLIAQSRALGDIRWTDETIRQGSASAHDLGPSGDDWIGDWLLLGGIAGLAVAWRRPGARVIGAWALLATLVAAGMHLAVFGWHPYAWLVDHVDQLARLRSPFRATAFSQLGAAVLTGLAVDRLWNTRSEHRRLAGRLIAVAAVVAAVVSVHPGPGRLVRTPATDTAMVRWLRGHPGGAVMYAPVAASGHVEDFDATAAEMLRGLVHHHPLVNGYSGFFPGEADEDLEVLRGFPDGQSVDTLRRINVRFVYARARWWAEHDDGTSGPYQPVVVARPPGWVVLRLPRA